MPFVSQKRGEKGSFLQPGVVVYSFSNGTILIDMIRTNQLEL